MRKTFRKKVGRTFISGGLGRHGPYILAYKKIDKKTGIKTSFGTRGLELQVDKKIGRRTRVSAGYSSVRGPYAGVNFRRRKRGIGALLSQY